MKSLIIIGAGGHGKVCADVAFEMKLWRDIYFLDDYKTGNISSFKILGKVKLDDYSNAKFDFFVAYGDNILRKEMIEVIINSNRTITTLIHPNSTVSSNVEIGVGVVVMPNTVINSSTSLGKGVIINSSAIVEHDCSVGDYVHISPGVIVSGTVKIGEGSWIGAGATIVNNIEITSEVTVGASSLVLRNIINSGTYIGIPSKLIRKNQKK